MREIIEGEGELEVWERPGKRLPVSYWFDIETEVRGRPGFPVVAADHCSTGVVRPLSGQLLAEGYYRLFASNGEILKVKNLGLDQWAILAS